MKPFRKNVALAVDGGGIKGVAAARALSVLEEHLQKPGYEIFRLLAGTSTGAIIAAGVATGMFGAEMVSLYSRYGGEIFRRTWCSHLWPLTRYRYPLEPLRAALQKHLGPRRMGDFWNSSRPCDVVMTAFDLVENRTLFIKPYKKAAGYDRWPVVEAVLASSAVPTVFPPVQNRYVDGGVGSYHNPCYLAAYEAKFVLGWDPAETTLISLGTGRSPHSLQPEQIRRFWPWDWITPVLGAFQSSADDQQVHLVKTFFPELDFRRFQVDLREPIRLDDYTRVPELLSYGEELGRNIINDSLDSAMDVQPQRAPRAI